MVRPPTVRPRHRRLKILLSCIVILMAPLAAALVWLGPLLSGGFFLSWTTGLPPASHDLPAGFEPIHRGHVDFSTGLYVREDDDLVLGGDLPFVLRRTYLSGYRISRHFGIGTTHPGEWFLTGNPSDLRWIDLILADGSRVHFNRTSSGQSYLNGMFVHSESTDEFYGARLGWTGLHWVMRFPNETRVTFDDCDRGAEATCSIAEIQDSDNHFIMFDRDADAVLRTIHTEDRSIAFDYDNHKRITAARDNAGLEVKYTYDKAGRLVNVIGSDGIRRTYTYGPRDELLAIDQPDRLVENTYDETGRRVVRQVTQMKFDGQVTGISEMRLAYTVSNDSITQTVESWNDGTRNVYRFDAQHHLICSPDTSRPSESRIIVHRP